METQTAIEFSSSAGDVGTAFDPGDLARGIMHCWHFDIDRAMGKGDILFQVLDREDRDRSVRIGNNLARHRFMAFRALLRITLGRYLDIPPDSIALAVGPHGKPRLAGSDDFHGLVFNASHTAARGAIALALDGHLGIDIQHWRTVGDTAALIRRCLADSEQAYWHQMEDSRRHSELFRFWTLKEAFCKAVGRGLALGLNRCVFDCTGPVVRLIAHPDNDGDPRDWHFAELDLPAGTSGAIAFSGPIHALRHYTG